MLLFAQKHEVVEWRLRAPTLMTTSRLDSRTGSHFTVIRPVTRWLLFVMFIVCEEPFEPTIVPTVDSAKPISLVLPEILSPSAISNFMY
jgi:hypothetical protein